MSDVVSSFNERAQNLLELHLASGFRKYSIWFKGKLQGSHVALIQEGKDLVNYPLINAIAIRKILKKYDKVHFSKQGQAFRSQAQSMHIEILQSPWLCELTAFHINLRETKVKSGMTPAIIMHLFWKSCGEYKEQQLQTERAERINRYRNTGNPNVGKSTLN
ncbi:E3 ubiquitin-protein ligase BAH1 [Hibiscus syriacus]|uniref:RING-type E3 ubiquitin transferase n=1 Tax=Hibiscus syriacus TaxID=106335 RepID=A0A6A2XUE6_HIBSY|nr:E3 ubiquitin-protein ligase BAH1 [Hibiscus syriacus]